MWNCLSFMLNMLLFLMIVVIMSSPSKAEESPLDEAYQTAICSEVLGELKHFEEQHIVEEKFLKLTDEFGPIGWTELRVIKKANKRTRLQWLNFCYDTYVKDAYEATNGK